MLSTSKSFLLPILLLIFCGVPLNSAVSAEDTSPSSIQLGLHFTELPKTIKELRYAFECEDGLEIEARWIAQNVGEAAPANYLIGKVKMKTQGPLNLAQLSRPTNGWPLGLYRLELWHNQKLIHTVYYVIEELEDHQ
jgi:hypothetical protein